MRACIFCIELHVNLAFAYLDAVLWQLVVLPNINHQSRHLTQMPGGLAREARKDLPLRYSVFVGHQSGSISEPAPRLVPRPAPLLSRLHVGELRVGKEQRVDQQQRVQK